MDDPYADWWRRSGDKQRGFCYADPTGRPITAPASLARIRSLHLPPAWRDVRIAPWRDARLQAVGFDERGRRQYRYHSRWTQQQATRKFARLVAFLEALPLFRATTHEHLQSPTLDRDAALALASRLLHLGAFRIGTDRYLKENHSYGLSTLETHHVSCEANGLIFSFEGKRGIRQRRVVCDPLLADRVRALLEAPGPRLLRYETPEGEWVPLTGRDVNAYLKRHMGPAFSAKDFRTWDATLLAAQALERYGPSDSERACRRNLARCAREVAVLLGNTPAIARSSYIAPRVFEAYAQGITLAQVRSLAATQLEGLEPDEAALAVLLRGRPSRAEPPARRDATARG